MATMPRQRLENLIEFYRGMVAGTEDKLTNPRFEPIQDKICARNRDGSVITYRQAWEQQLANAKDRLAYYESMLEDA